MWCGARDDCTFEMIMGMAVFGATGGNPSGSRPNFFGRQHLTFDKGGKCGGAGRGDSAEWRSRWGDVVAVKALCFTAGHHFDEC